MTKDDCIGSICHRIFTIGRTQDDIVIFVRQFMVITQHQVGLIFVYTGTGNGVMRTNDVVVPAVFQGVVEAVHIVQLGRCAFCVFLAAAGHRIAYAHDLGHVGTRHGVAAAHDHDLAAAGGNGILQRTIQCFRILQVLHDGTGLLEVDGPIGIGDAVSCAVDQGGIGIGGHIGLADDAVRYAAEGLGSAGIVINVECTIGEGCGAAEVIAARLCHFIHDAGERTGHGGSDAAGVGHVPGCEACKFLGSFVVRIGIRFELIDDRHFSIVRFVDAVILGLGVIADPFQLGHVHGIRIIGTGGHTRNLAGHGAIGLAHGHSRIGGIPGGIRRSGSNFGRRIVPCHAFIHSSHGPAAQGHAPIFLDVGIMAQQDGVGNAGGEGLIRIAQDDVVDFGRSQGMLIADDGIAAGAFIQGVAGTDDFGIADVGAGVMIAVNQVIFAHGFFRSLQGIVDAHQLGRLGPISCVAAADGQYSTTGGGLYRTSEGI